MIRKILFLFVCLPLFFLAQNEEEDYVNDNVLRYDDYVYKSNIRTVQFHESNWEYAPAIIDLNNNEQLELAFDDLNANNTPYSITFIHCNADWTPSNLMTSEYIQGFFELSILSYDFSQATMQKYAHYSILFPQQSMRFTKSGNYLMYVYANNEKTDLVLSRRFMISDNKINVSATFRQAIGGDDQFKKQHLDFTIKTAGYDINNPQRDMKVVLVQNNRWDNAVTDIKPTFISQNQFTYSLDDASTFDGGNEFRYFDIRSTKFLTERVEKFYRDDSMKYHANLQMDELRGRKPYLFYNDFNGNFLIKNSETAGNPDLEADYVYVNFFIRYPKPESEGNIYLMGKLTDWRMNKRSKMTYNYTRMGYETTLYLKQGYYNYMYVLSNDAKKDGDETGTEGSFWDTENDYNIYVYHRKFGTYYDQLIGVKKLNTLRK